jgi:hypothetical protein
MLAEWFGMCLIGGVLIYFCSFYTQRMRNDYETRNCR